MAKNSQDRSMLFPFSFNVCRKNINNPKEYDKGIYDAFGLGHKSNTSNIYISALNTVGSSAVCQPIGEAITLVKRFITSLDKGQPIAHYKTNNQGTESYLEIRLTQEYRDEGIVIPDLYSYEIYRKDNKITISAYNHVGWLLPDVKDNVIHYHPLHKLMPIFALLLLDHKLLIPEFSDCLENFAHNPSIEAFVRLHEDFYHMYKKSSYEVVYDDMLNYQAEIHKLTERSYYNKTISAQKKTKTKKPVIIQQFSSNIFTPNQQSYIPSLPKELVLPDEYRSYCNAVYDGASLATLFHGPSGTGKSMLCKLICQAINLPIMQTINCSENLDEFIFGKYIPKDDKIIFSENPITEAVRSGGAVIFEEINFAKPQHLAFLHSLLDDNGMITLDDGTTIKRHKNFRFFATMNDGYFGTKELNQATLNRITYIKEVPELCDVAIKNMLKARVPQFAKYVDQILQVYKGIKAKALEEDIDITISPRNLENWAKIAQYEGFITAAKSTIIPVAKMDRKLEDAIMAIIKTHKWDA